MQALVKKRFVAYFSEHFVGGEQAKPVSMGFFTEENGFRPEEIRDVARMAVDQILNIPVGQMCKVWRVK